MTCEGWDRADDKYVLRGSCGLRYELVSSANSSGSDWVSTLFLIVFWAFFGYIVLCCLYAIFGPRPDTLGSAPGQGPDAPPPPYPGQGKPDSWRPGFWSGMGLGAIAARLFGPGRQRTAYPYGPSYGTMPPSGAQDYYYGHNHAADVPSSSTTHSSAGFGGTENR